MEKLFELEDALKVLQLKGVNVDICFDILHEIMATTYINGYDINLY